MLPRQVRRLRGERQRQPRLLGSPLSLPDLNLSTCFKVAVKFHIGTVSAETPEVESKRTVVVSPANSKLCDVCIGVLHQRKNLLVPGTKGYELASVETPVIKEDEEEATDSECGPHERAKKLRKAVEVKCGHHRTSVTLMLSAAAGCHICEPLWNQCSTSEQQRIQAADAKNAQEAATIASNDKHADPAGYEFLSYATTLVTNRKEVDATLFVQSSSDPGPYSFTLPSMIYTL